VIGPILPVLLMDENQLAQMMSIAQPMKAGVTEVWLPKVVYGASGEVRQDADIIVMIHPDYQYDPRLMPAMAHMINSGVYDVVLGSRILGKGARIGGMPIIKYIANRFLTLFQNILINQKLSEYHTGYRAFSKILTMLAPSHFYNSNNRF
jgi:hypothetical protein